MSKTPAETSRALIRALRAFVSSMHAMRETAHVARDSFPDYTTVERLTKTATRVFPMVSESTHLAAAEALYPMVLRRTEGLADLASAEADFQDTEAFVQRWETEAATELERVAGSGAFVRYSRIWARVARTPHTAALLRKSLLVSGVADFETFVGAVLREYVAAKPQVLREVTKTFTFSDLDAFESFEDFHAAQAESYVDAHLRAGFAGWMGWLQRHGVSVQRVTHDNDALNEVFQRRHLFVHNDGVVNESYLRNVSRQNPPPVAQRLRVSDRYLAMALDRLTLAAFKITGVVHRKLVKQAPESDRGEQSLTEVCVELLQEEAYSATSAVCRWMRDWARSPGTVTVTRVNGWLARLALEGRDSIRSEVLLWPLDDDQSVYHVVRATLLGNQSLAYSLARELVDEGELDPENWDSWPVFSELRTYESQVIPEADRIAAPAFSQEDAGS